jgi:ABC-2 type transport system ATP-binding protein
MIQVEGLTKYYGPHAAIRDLSFRIERGEVIGFLGLNGAGKTTTLKVLGCVLLPTSGKVTIDGFDVVRDPHEIRKRIGFLPDSPPLYDEMTVGEYLAFVARLRGVPAEQTRKRVEEAEEQTSTREVDRDVITSLSHGFRQRVGVAQALVHKPALVILDEPSSGLDPRQIIEMRALIQRLKGEHTILVSSHILSELSQMCDRLLVINEGQIVAQGTEEELAQRAGGEGSIEVEVHGSAAKVTELIRTIPQVKGARVVSESNGAVVVRVDAATDLSPQIARTIVNAGLDLLRLQRETQALEGIFLRLTKGKGLPS